jgi:hypothetical protein
MVQKLVSQGTVARALDLQCILTCDFLQIEKNFYRVRQKMASRALELQGRRYTPGGMWYWSDPRTPSRALELQCMVQGLPSLARSDEASF